MSTSNATNRADRSAPAEGGRALPPPFTPPEGSTAARRIVVPDKGSLRGALVTRSERPRVITYESNVERRVLLVLLARPDVVELREQVEPVSYADADGIPRKHTFDFLVTRSDGTRILVAVKHSGWVLRHPEFEPELALIARKVPKRMADRVVMMTDREASRDQVHDAALIHSARADRRPEDDRVVNALAISLVGTTTVGALVAASGLEGRGFRAIVRLIAKGVLRRPHGGRIAYGTEVSSVTQQGARQ
ncbi:Tn7 transposase TnsA N-terminal domain-containing protein [Methylobacterium sp. J-001]|uniref:Tn7 transposase TnsA N-terminal domain-containing protein n=1 Tax=Methylobacterium sp. J-001 TaxID=2836609 RepID=UPI001FB921D7|nr:Tn7 transposase TnsA N-terminal domain-containing protein [Methylobacterium sp. J-001]MCJ2120007.1 Tn7 transposase TnsA N-terminal domain-containing protein [Methylobacterium sp. J-001]